MTSETATSMTVKYALTRSEIAISYLRSLVASSKFRTKIILYSLAPAVLNLLITLFFERTLTRADLLDAAMFAGFVFILFPVELFVLGKTAERTLTISKDGISTVIGKKRGQISWKKISILSESPQFILIADVNGNSFFIPNRAFPAVEDRQFFMTELRNWAAGER